MRSVNNKSEGELLKRLIKRKYIDTTQIAVYYNQLSKIILESGKLKGSLAKKHCYKQILSDDFEQEP